MAERIRAYTPSIDPAHWDAIADFVRSAVDDAGPQTQQAMKAMFGAVAPLVHRCWLQGMPLDRDLIFGRENIERFIARDCPPSWAKSTRGTYRSWLFQVSDTLAGVAPTRPSAFPLPQSTASRPYSLVEQTALRAWAGSLSTEPKRRNATVLLATMLGAGLGVDDLLGLRVPEVGFTGGALVISVGGRRPRETVVLDSWAGDLAGALTPMGPSDFAFGQGRRGSTRNAVTHFLASCTGEVQPQSQRLRATWIVHHLTIGTPLRALLDASGIKTVDGLDRFLPFVPAADPSRARTALRGVVSL